MSNEFGFDVPGRAQGKGRGRVDARSGRVFTPPATREAERKIATLARAAMPRGWPMTGHRYHLSVAICPRNRQHECDVDNVLKLVSDALNRIAWPDDRLVDVVFACRQAPDVATVERVSVHVLAVQETPSAPRKAKKEGST